MASQAAYKACMLACHQGPKSKVTLGEASLALINQATEDAKPKARVTWARDVSSDDLSHSDTDVSETPAKDVMTYLKGLTPNVENSGTGASGDPGEGNSPSPAILKKRPSHQDPCNTQEGSS